MQNIFKEIILNETAKNFDFRKFIFLKKKKILITGATGVVGNYFISFFLNFFKLDNSPKHLTICHISKLPKYLNFLRKNKKINFIKKNLVNLKKKDIHNYDIIIHLSSYGQPNKFVSKPIETFQLNTKVLHILLSKLNKNGKFLFLSTSEIYSGNKKNNTEDNIGKINTNHSRSSYIFSKLAGETLINIYRNKFKIDAKSIRLCLAYGPGSKINDERVLYQFINKSLKTKKIKMMDKGNALRSYIYVLDALKMMINILFFGKSEIYNVGGKKIISIKNLAKKITKITNAKLLIPNKKTFLKGAPEKANISIKKYEKEFGKIKLTNIDSGLKETLEWHRNLK